MNSSGAVLATVESISHVCSLWWYDRNSHVKLCGILAMWKDNEKVQLREHNGHIIMGLDGNFPTYILLLLTGRRQTGQGRFLLAIWAASSASFPDAPWNVWIPFTDPSASYKHTKSPSFTCQWQSHRPFQFSTAPVGNELLFHTTATLGQQHH